LDFGLGTEDTPMFSNMHEASAFLVGGTLTAVDAVLENQADHALHLGGGLHHGFKRKASGFCIYNDGAIAIQYIRDRKSTRLNSSHVSISYAVFCLMKEKSDIT